MLENNYSTLTINDIQPGRSGYVYLLKAVGTPRYKIGRSNQPLVRSQKITVQSPYPLIVSDCFWTPDCVTDENFLHETFLDYRVYGEYFEFGWDMESSEDNPLKGKLLSYLGHKLTLPCTVKGSYVLSCMARSCENFLIQEYQKHNNGKQPLDVPFDLFLIFGETKDFNELNKIHKFVYEYLPRQIAFSSTRHGGEARCQDYIAGLIVGYLHKLYLDGE